MTRATTIQKSTAFYFNDKRNTFMVYNAKEVYGHDDSWPFNADWKVIDNVTKKVVLSGSAWNDGWGGPTNVHLEEGDKQTLDSVNNQFKSIFKYKYKGFDIEDGIDDVVTFMAMLNIMVITAFIQYNQFLIILVNKI